MFNYADKTQVTYVFGKYPYLENFPAIHSALTELLDSFRVRSFELRRKAVNWPHRKEGAK